MIAIDKTPVENRGDPLSPIWWRGKQWAVTEYGIECLNGRYCIDANALRMNMGEYSWMQHMRKKNWVDSDDFNTAFLVALSLHENEQLRDEILQASEALFEHSQG